MRQTLLTEFRQVFGAVRNGSYPYRSRKPKPRVWASYDRAQMCEAPDVIRLIGGAVDEASVRIRRGCCRPCWNAYPKPLLAKLILTQQYDGRCNRVGVGLLRLFRESLGVEATHAGLSYKTLERGYSDPTVIAILNEVFFLTQRPVNMREEWFAVDGTCKVRKPTLHIRIGFEGCILVRPFGRQCGSYWAVRRLDKRYLPLKSGGPGGV